MYNKIIDSYEPPYDLINESINKSKYKDFALFFNLGYLPDNNISQSKFELQNPIFNRNSIRLVLEIIGDTDLNNKNILDIGCGRGGTIQVINSYFKPSGIVGIDISKSSIEYCEESNKQNNVSFYVKDAYNNALDDGIFDVAFIIELKNIEPSIFPVYNETFRVLKKNGILILAGVFIKEYYKDTIDTINSLFKIISNNDVTSNVILSAASDAQSRVNLLSRILPDSKMIEDFLITPNNQTFISLQDNKAEYRIIRMMK